MPRSDRKSSKARGQDNIEPYEHQYEERPNNPQVGMVAADNDSNTAKKQYAYDPHLDPTLVWSGKKEKETMNINTVSIHVHERIDPRAIISKMRKQSNGDVDQMQTSLFDPSLQRPLREEMSFYEHKNAWVNRLIAGDSLLVMNSLLEKEGMAGSVQMIYIDPPYGIKYGSNFQPYTNQTSVVDGKDKDLNVEPETIKAFRDTWELGIHSYLSYMRDRLLLARELLKETGSCFVQISDENLHYIKGLMEEIFGTENYIDIIPFWKTSGLQESYLASVCNYLVWFAKDKKKAKYRQLYLEKQIGGSGASAYNQVETAEGKVRSISKGERATGSIPAGARLFSSADLQSQGNPIVQFEFEGCKYSGRWKTNLEGMGRLADANRILAGTKTLRYKRYFDDFPIYPLTNLWTDTGTGGDYKTYVVQTNDKVIQRCVLMTTDPGDLVLDPTCGSGTTAFVAEQWGRRWITIDTSRISIQLTRSRLLTSIFDWYKLIYKNEGVRGGFIYNKVPHVTLGSIARGEDGEEAILYDQPEVSRKVVRVSGPFTVEALPAINVQSLPGTHSSASADSSVARTGQTAKQEAWRNELLKTGINTKGGKKIELVRVEVGGGVDTYMLKQKHQTASWFLLVLAPNMPR